MRTHQFVYSLLAGLLLFTTNTYAIADEDNIIRWAGCGITKKAFMAELAKGFEKKTGIKVMLEGGGATRGIRDTSTLKVDIGGSCRMTLPESDRSELFANLHPIAWDALAIIVHKNNPIQNIRTQQVKDIYTGKITNWKQLGGADAPIQLYVRKGNVSGVGYAIRQYIFKDGGIKFPTPHQVQSSGPLEKAVEQDRHAIGITGISSARKRNVKIIGFDGKEPSIDNLMAGKYQLYRPLYLVTSTRPSKNVKEFISYASSHQGREIIRKNQTVPYKDAPNLMSKMIVYGFDVK